MLTGKVAVITGASRGIGRATAIELAKRGAFVIVNYRGSEAAALETVAEIKSAWRGMFLIMQSVKKISNRS